MIDLPVLALLGLAGYRGTQLAVHDTILNPARNRIHNWQAKRPTSGPRLAVTMLIECIYCTGWWVSGALLLTYLLATGTWHDATLLVHGIEWLAVAGVQSLANRFDDTLDTRAAA
ncbi:DUF1360 domain-containing protein [Streptomyces sp. 111WW2]|uniref:DUF1360 domain-containing protein n=1 Tax=Streptomyces sp. 111WW2 TaxID=1945515 RepID=UPI000D0C7DED|nr:DUF1360 domain-containing protein [Streptomyces sp. 111WW2]